MSFEAFLNGMARGLEDGVRLYDTVAVAKERKKERKDQAAIRGAGAPVPAAPATPTATPPTDKPEQAATAMPARVVGALGIPQGPPSALPMPRADYSTLPETPINVPSASPASILGQNGLMLAPVQQIRSY